MYIIYLYYSREIKFYVPQSYLYKCRFSFSIIHKHRSIFNCRQCNFDNRLDGKRKIEKKKKVHTHIYILYFR